MFWTPTAAVAEPDLDAPDLVQVAEVALRCGPAHPKTVKNRLHIDIHASGDEPHAGQKVPLEVRRQRVDAEASRLAALGATQVAVLHTDGLDHYAIAMRDPEGNEFDIN